MADYDVIIIGTGAGGGTLAGHLAPSGKRILLLERGDWLPREPANWDTQAVANALRVGDHLLERLAASSASATAVT
jgi:choline dehydrogenase-like flavoprotein